VSRRPASDPARSITTQVRLPARCPRRGDGGWDRTTGPF
jgi:hypothetical protein